MTCELRTTKIKKSCDSLPIKRNKIMSHGDCRKGNVARLYNIWRAMKQRCDNPGKKGYNRYGGRGIKVCKEWIDDYGTFKEWAMSNGYKANLTIDRKNNDKNYYPLNCRWVTMEINVAKRNVPCRVLTFKQATEIRNSDLRNFELAKKYEVSQGVIHFIKHNKTYKKDYKNELCFKDQ